VTATLLVARAARIAVDDVVAIPELTLETRGNRLVVAGHASPLLCALTGIAEGGRRGRPGRGGARRDHPDARCGARDLG
jgi:ABC-2 type transport system ATP-binding protein